MTAANEFLTPQKTKTPNFWCVLFTNLISSIFETHFNIKTNEKILRFDLAEIIFKFKKSE